MTPELLYFAFADGALRYDCAPCGRCCRGLGLAYAAPQLATRPEPAAMHAFVAGPAGLGATASPLLNFYTYADGCRFLEADNRCGIHARHGAGAKPAICRLFPLSRLVDVDGLWTLLPDPSCPWTASDTPSDLSRHAGIAADLAPLLDAGVLPKAHPVVTRLPSATRRALEIRLREVWSTFDEGLTTSRDATCEVAGVWPEPPLELWLDLLRCAGEPPPLPAATRRLLAAAAPALRIELTSVVPLAAIPTAMAGLELYLRSLIELAAPVLRGDDLMRLFSAATPLLRVLSAAALARDTALGTLTRRGILPAPFADRLAQPAVASIGEALVYALRQVDHGTVETLRNLGRLWELG